MKKLLEELRPRLIAVAAFSFFMNLLLVVPAVFSLQVFDRVLPTNSLETLTVLIGGTLVVLFILMGLDYVRTRMQNVMGGLIDDLLSPHVVNTVVTRTARARVAASSEGVRDVAALRQVFSSNALLAVFDAPWAIIYVAVIWMFHPMLGLGALVCTVAMLALAWINDRINRQSLEDLQMETRKAAGYVESSMRNAEVLQALGMTGTLLARWRHLQDGVADLQTTASKSGSVFAALSKFLRQGIQVFMMSLGAYLVLSQQASPGIMIATTILIGRAIQPVELIVGSLRSLIDGRAAYHRLVELAQEFEDGKDQVKLPRPEGKLTVEGISYKAPGSDKPLIINVGFALEAGEALAIIGRSAAGKSTLARLLTGVWAPNTGVVRLDAADIAYWPRKDLGPWMGYVPQDVELFAGTVADNIARLGQVDSEAVVAAAKRANVHELILALPKGYDTPVGDMGTRLSPGQRQRIALARALYGDPRLVVLDEPNSNLDNEGEVALAQAMNGLRAAGVTSVVITHRPSLIAHVDKVLVLDAGRVQKFGPTREVMKSLQQQSQVIVGDKAQAANAANTPPADAQQVAAGGQNRAAG
jgi:PrtD family type I secretion system ABC transporter